MSQSKNKKQKKAGTKMVNICINGVEFQNSQSTIVRINNGIISIDTEQKI